MFVLRFLGFNMKNYLLILFSAFSMTFSVSAQDGGNDDILQQSMQDIFIVAGTGAAGAILGLSTLSFVEEPSEHLNNIIVGGAIGIIIGVGIVAFKQANVSQDIYQGQGYIQVSEPQMTTAMRRQWHRKNHYQINNNLGNDSSSLPGVNFQFAF